MELAKLEFDWRIYADATCAGLSALIPVPLVDLGFERAFRRRMPRAIAAARKAELEPGLQRALGRSHVQWLSLSGCLVVPLFLVRYVIRKLWRKVIYIFAVTDAATSVSTYWHRAALIDHMVRAGHLAPGTDHGRAVAVFEKVLRDADTGSLVGLAGELIGSAGRLSATLVRARRGGAVGATRALEQWMVDHWDRLEASMALLTARYNAEYAAWQRPPTGA